jgi:hypothetical protein
MSGGEWNTQRDRKQQAADARELLREQIRLEKRLLRDLRWAIERSTIESSDWADLLQLHQQHGKEGLMQLWRELVPYWRDCQRVNHGADIPPELFPQAMGDFSRTAPVAPATRSKAAVGAPRKKRSDAGKAQPSRK